jgi:hypothetical protein
LFGLNGITYDHLDNKDQVMIVLNEIQKLKFSVKKYQFVILENWINNEKTGIYYGNK